MAQHDMVIDNGSGLAVRTDINAAIQALASTSLGPVEPTVKYAGQLWLDTTVSPNGLLRMRNQANAAWVSMPVGAPLQSSFIQRQVILTTGAITLHADTKAFQVEVQGGGGGGGAGTATGAFTGSAGGGGGAGGYSSRWVVRPTGTYSPACTVAAASAAGGAGNSSSFVDGTYTLSCTGGGAGSPGVANGVAAPIATQGGGGGGASGGDVIVGGSQGEHGLAAAVTGTVVSAAPGQGASSQFGAGGSAGTAWTGSAANAAGTGGGYGAGGSGSYAVAGSSGPAGSTGGAGVVVITEYR